MKKTIRAFKTGLCVILSAAMVSMAVLPPVETAAAVKDYGNGIRFDAQYYAALYPELVAIIGNDETALLNHYLLIGIFEGRTAYEGQSAEEIANLKIVFSGQTQAQVNADPSAGADRTVDTASTPQPGTVTETPAASGQSAPQPASLLDATDNAFIERLANALATGQMTQEQVDAAMQATYGDGAAAVAQEEALPGAVPAAEGPQKSNGLVLVYMNGTDLETNSSSATGSINGMIQASASGNTRFVILAGGTKKWTLPVMQSANNGKVVSYVIENGTIRQLDEYKEGLREGLSNPGNDNFLYRENDKTIHF